ncbi:MAG: acyltransferase [Christiangramia sp.]|nr:acyltransferase [Christiangramia sp.]
MATQILRVLKKVPNYIKAKSEITFHWWIFGIAKNWTILNRISPKLRPALWKLTGCKIGENVAIGYDVYYDVGNASLIHIEDEVWIASRSLILCHKRDLSKYYKNERYNDLSYQKHPVIFKKGCVVGMGCIVMPGVTIGEGAIIGAGSLVVSDIPAWTIAVGNPAKVVKQIQERVTEEK